MLPWSSIIRSGGEVSKNAKWTDLERDCDMEMAGKQRKKVQVVLDEIGWDSCEIAESRSGNEYLSS